MEAILYIIILLLLKHFLADFLWQPKEMALAKINNYSVLTAHALIHGVSMMFLLNIINWVIMPINSFLLVFIPLFDFSMHWLIDACTGKAKKNDELTPQDKKFWNLIGLDQFAHNMSYLIIILFIT